MRADDTVLLLLFFLSFFVCLAPTADTLWPTLTRDACAGVAVDVNAGSVAGADVVAAARK